MVENVVSLYKVFHQSPITTERKGREEGEKELGRKYKEKREERIGRRRKEKINNESQIFWANNFSGHRPSSSVRYLLKVTSTSHFISMFSTYNYQINRG